MKDPIKSNYTQLRKEAFARGLKDLMMQMPYEKIAVQDLCTHLDISRKTFYRYFSNKEDALHTLIDLTLFNIGAYIPPVPILSDHPLESEMILFFHYWSENRKFLQVLLENSLIETLLFQLVSISLSEMKTIWEDIAPLKRSVQESIASFFIGGLLSILLHWLRDDFAESPEEMAERVVQLTEKAMGSKD